MQQQAENTAAVLNKKDQGWTRRNVLYVLNTVIIIIIIIGLL